LLATLRRIADRLAETPATFHWLRKLPEANYRATKSRIAALVATLDRPRVLDLGCGTGEYAELFDPERYLGVDIHPGSIAFAAAHRPSHRFECADVRDWKGPELRFDLVLVNGVLHHLDDDAAREFLTTARGLRAPGGRLLVIEDVTLEDAPLPTRLVHRLDYGEHIRDVAAWQALVSAIAPIERSETYWSGVCPYHWMLCRPAGSDTRS
jgi:SAM-dependent methyltransferase